MPKLEANLAAIRHAEVRREWIGAERALGSELRELERLLGRDPAAEAMVLVGDPRVSSADVDDEAALLQLAFDRRPDLRARQAEVERIDAELALTRRLIVPNPTFSGGYEREAQAGGGSDPIARGRSTSSPGSSRRTI